MECDFCGDEFGEKQLLTEHLISHHPNYSSVTTESDKMLKEEDQLLNKFSEELREEKEQGAQSRNDQPDCHICGKVFTNRKKLTDHMRSAHERPANCELCGRWCPSRKQFVVHKRRKHSIEQFKCEKCEETFTRKDTLQRHLKVCHTKKRNSLLGPYLRKQRPKREETDYKFGMEHFLKESFATNSHVKTESVEEKFNDEQISKEDYGVLKIKEQNAKQEIQECHMCDRKFALRRQLSDHIRGVHTDPSNCEQCGKSCSSRKRLLEHKLRKHSKEKFSCENCEEIFTRKDALPRHTKVCQGKKKRNKMENREMCSICKETFSIPSSLRRHVRKKHPEEFKTSTLNAKYLLGNIKRTWHCVKCNYVAKRKDRLKKHFSAKHRKGKVYECGACEFNSSVFASLERHRQEFHEGEKLFKCVECAKTFAFHKGLRQHRTRVHSVDTFSCTQCAKEFNWKPSAERHELVCGKPRVEVPWEELSVSGKKWRVKRILGEFGNILS